MSNNTYHLTREDLRKPESRATMMNDLMNPSTSNVSTLKSAVDRNTDKGKEIDERKANLPLPDQPPTASDWNSVDQNTVNVGTGRVEGAFTAEGNGATRDPSTAASSARVSGSELHMTTEP